MRLFSYLKSFHSQSYMNYFFSTLDVNGFSRSNSPSETMLWRLGSFGMVAFELVHLLDQLRLESLLMDIKEYGMQCLILLIQKKCYY